jgi:ATP-dependent 26S proteasome regulatory subunit
MSKFVLPEILENKIPVDHIASPLKDKMPAWFYDLANHSQAGIGNLFILWGNIFDWQKNMAGKYLTVHQMLAEAFCDYRLVMFYSLSNGLQFATQEMEKYFREKYCKIENDNGDEDPAFQKAQESLNKSMLHDAPISSLIGDTPAKALPFLDRVMTDMSEGNKLLIVDSAQNIVPETSGHSGDPGNLVSIEILERWSRDRRIQEMGNIIILMTPSLFSLSKDLRSNQSAVIPIKISKPKDKQRAIWVNKASKNLKLIFAEKATPEIITNMSGGLSLYQINNIFKLARQQRLPIDLDLIASKKKEILNNEFDGHIDIRMPKWDFNSIGGLTNKVAYANEINGYIHDGIYRRVPMGILAAGPPGTCKSHFFECWAKVCGYNVVRISNPRIMYVGQSEALQLSILAALDEMAPVIVLEDEADQSETSRGAPSGDSGVSNRWRQMKFDFCSDAKRRGRVIWVRISNRDDLIDVAYKRKGRTDVKMPFVIEYESYPQIFKVMFPRYEIQTNISDFRPFAKEVEKKIYCTGSDIEWMVREADRYAGREDSDLVLPNHLSKAVDAWEMDANPNDIDMQTILAHKGSSKDLRAENWEQIMQNAYTRLRGRRENTENDTVIQMPSVFPNLRSDEELKN